MWVVIAALAIIVLILAVIVVSLLIVCLAIAIWVQEEYGRELPDGEEMEHYMDKALDTIKQKLF